MAMSLYFEEYGQGKPVVFPHGWTSNHEVYQEAAKALADKARFILYDHRGHYMSKEATGKEVTLENLASDLRELIVGLDLDEVTLVGWSMGATTILSYVDLFGCDGISQIALCDMTPKRANDETWKLGLYQGAYTAEDEALDRPSASNTPSIPTPSWRRFRWRCCAWAYSGRCGSSTSRLP